MKRGDELIIDNRGECEWAKYRLGEGEGRRGGIKEAGQIEKGGREKEGREEGREQVVPERDRETRSSGVHVY